MIGKLNGTSAHVEVYDAYGINECAQDPWDAIDAAAIKAEETADFVSLNGPRCWLIDAFLIRTRVLTSDLEVTAVDGVATVV